MTESLEKQIVQKIRIATEEDEKNLPTYSYSRLDTFRQCPYRFFLKYRKEVPTNEKAVALEVGTFCHSIMEERGNAFKIGGEIPSVYDVLAAWENDFLNLKKDFKAEWKKLDKTGRDYDDKFGVFWSYYKEEMTDPSWRVIDCEKEFKFVFDNKFILYGFIDRVDRNLNGQYKVTDYKTASHIYSQKDRDYAMQMFVYALAVYVMYGKFPAEFEYDFVFFGEKRSALEATDSFKKCFEELADIFKRIEKHDRDRQFIPKPTPLCWWCPYGADTKFENHDRCQFYSEWRPDNKVHRNHKNFIAGTFDAEVESSKTKNKIVW